jgi:DNA-binding beta-propeller fold protein YncE
LRNLIIITVCLLFVTCKKQEIGPQHQTDPLFSGEKVLILNEGNFGWGNASISAYSPDDFNIANGVFSSVNSSSLGDVVQSGVRWNAEYLIVVNNSGKVISLDTGTLDINAEITGLTSPRYILPLNGSRAYVTDLFSSSISIINLLDYSISSVVPVDGWVEEMQVANGEVYATRPLNSSLLRIDTSSNAVIDSVNIGLAPTSIVKDQNELLWVLCAGSVSTPASIVKFNPISNTIISTFSFALGESPSQLKINGAGDQLYYLNDGLFSLSISALELDVNALASGFGNTLYGLAIHPITNEVYVTDAEDFIQPGDLFRLTSGGALIDSVKAGIIPQAIIF